MVLTLCVVVVGNWGQHERHTIENKLLNHPAFTYMAGYSKLFAYVNRLAIHRISCGSAVLTTLQSFHNCNPVQLDSPEESDVYVFPYPLRSKSLAFPLRIRPCL